MPQDPEEQLPLRLGVLRSSCCHTLGVLGRGGTWRTWCPRGPKCHCTWQCLLSPVHLKALGCSHLGDHSRVSSAPGTPPALSLRSGTVAAAESRSGPCPPPWLPPPGCAMGKLRRRTGQGSEAIAGGRGGSPPSCATAVPGAAQPGPSAAIYLPWLARAGGRAVTRQLPNEGRRMAPGSSSCGGGDNGGSRAPNGFSWVSFLTASSPTPLPQQNPGRGSVPWRFGRCD